jgi:hypothetical protein
VILKQSMRATIPHNKPKDEARRAVDQAVDHLFRDTPAALIQITDQRKQWDGPVLRFWLSAKMGPVRNPIQGTIEVTDRELLLDVDLGMLNLLFPEQKFRKSIEDTLRAKLLGPAKS